MLSHSQESRSLSYWHTPGIISGGQSLGLCKHACPWLCILSLSTCLQHPGTGRTPGQPRDQWHTQGIIFGQQYQLSWCPSYSPPCAAPHNAALRPSAPRLTPPHPVTRCFALPHSQPLKFTRTSAGESQQHQRLLAWNLHIGGSGSQATNRASRLPTCVLVRAWISCTSWAVMPDNASSLARSWLDWSSENAVIADRSSPRALRLAA